ncbi:trypsin-like serine protease [Vibrio sp. THAF190c]|uniref:trypsin-like serine protease n=1 Tax=Vibrio sp. THAF190c TaxID=2587865 RepID=UPI001268A6DC|nr:trypsin-like serine protease [Vibrio sp. THAF190c]QFT13293.1 Trypsin [Vibrio sp. THAF190c]
MNLGKTKFTLGVLAALVSINAHAVRFGTDVSEDDYRDHTVRFQVENGNGSTISCGGLLIAGEYILTAGHCSGSSTYAANYTEYIPWLDGGASNDISVFVGIDYNGTEHKTTYSNMDVYGSFESAHNSLLTELTYLESIFGASKFTAQRGWQDLDWTRRTGFRDIALIKLNTKIEQQHQAALMPVFDSVSSSYNIVSGDTFTFRGWGRTETGASPSTMQETSLALPFTESQYNPNKPVDSSSTTTDCSASVANCELRIKDYMVIKPTVVGGTASSGDSGTPMLTSEDRAFAIASTENAAHTQNFFTNIGSYLENIASEINKVTAPSSMSFDMDTDATDTLVTTFQVQNLTQFTDNISPSLTGDTHNFEVSGCDSDLDTYQFCKVTVRVNPNGNAQTNDSNVVLHLNDTNNTMIPISLTVKDSSVTPPPTDTGGSSSGSSGGSTGLFSLLGLLMLGRLRKSK